MFDLPMNQLYVRTYWKATRVIDMKYLLLSRKIYIEINLPIHRVK
jgi:hypothetical protein